MKDTAVQSIAVSSLALIFFLVFSSPAQSAIAPAGHVIVTSGPFIAIQSDRSARSLTSGSEFYQGDTLWTGPRTRAQVRFSDGAIMTLRPDTEFRVEEYEFDEQNVENNRSIFSLIKGGFRTLTGLVARLRPDSYKVKTAYAIVGVRGTTYETVVNSALYVAAWDGTISITNNSAEMLLGFGQDYNYATVTSINSEPTGNLQVPPPLQQTVDPDLAQPLVDPTETRLVTAIENPISDILTERITPEELASLDRTGFAAFTGAGTGAPLSGAANDIDTETATAGNPILFDPTAGGPEGTVLRQGDALAGPSFTDTSLAGFPVSFGFWDATQATPATLQRNALDGSDIEFVESPVVWMTLFPATSPLPLTGTISYDTLLSFSGISNAGGITLTGFDAQLNFASGALTGNMSITDPVATWDVDFAGTLLSPQFSATANSATSTYDDGTGAVAGVTGAVTGSLTGNASGFGAQAPLGIGGVFDFEFGANDVAGTFLARYDGRFLAGEKAAVLASAQTGFAAFGGTGLAPFSGQTTDGAGGSPILFDSTAGPDGTALRQDGATAVNVATDPTGEGFAVSFGSWDGTTNAAVLLPDEDGVVQQPVSDFVHWITLQPPTNLPTGSVAYFAAGPAVASVGSGSGGPSVTVTRFQSDIDFGTGALSNGRMVVLNGANTWDAFFDGLVTAGSFTASLTAGSNVNGSAAVGGLEGAFTENGTGISGIGGVFDFEESGVPANNVQGAFVAREDRRFAAGELASMDQVGVAVASAPGPNQPFVGEASAGAGGSPILLDVAANEVLRQGAAPQLGSVTTVAVAPSFDVSWGAWNAAIGTEATIQGDPNTATATQLISDPVFWITAAPTPAAAMPTGTFSYSNVLGRFQGSGEAGTVNALTMSLDATLNLGSGAVTGNMQVGNGPRISGFDDQWDVNFSGSFTTGQLDAAVTGGTVTVDATVQPLSPTGTLNGVMTGPNGEGIAGGFNLQHGATNNVGGTFLVTQ
jgi:hypothetical protein